MLPERARVRARAHACVYVYARESVRLARVPDVHSRDQVSRAPSVHYRSTRVAVIVLILFATSSSRAREIY